MDKITNELQEAPQNHHTAQIRALARDGFRCVVTKAYDMFAAEDNAKLRQTIEKEGASTAVTDCTYVFPLSPGSDSEEMYAASVWALLDCFGYHNLRQKLNGDNVRRLENVITMDPTVHYLLGTLRIWLWRRQYPISMKLKRPNPYTLFTAPNS